ncbi:MAG: twin-arginine translocase subunit TatC [Alphaproteobacteria bacterium]
MPLKKDLMTHIVELRKRLMWSLFFFFIAFLFCYSMKENIYAFLVQPLATVLGEGNTPRMIFTGLTEPFIVYLKLSFYGALFLSFPFWMTQIWVFLTPALYTHERKVFLPFLFLAPVLFSFGAALAYFIVMPLAWEFFVSFQNQFAAMPLELETRISQYMSMVTSFLFAFGMSFQLPIILIVLNKIGIIERHHLIKFRKYAVVFAFILSMLLTPPDVVSQICLAIPLILLYEISIFWIKCEKDINTMPEDDA